MLVHHVGGHARERRADGEVDTREGCAGGKAGEVGVERRHLLIDGSGCRFIQRHEKLLPFHWPFDVRLTHVILAGRGSNQPRRATACAKFSTAE